MKKILFIGGHLTPALAVLSELENKKSVKIFWAGHTYNQAGNRKKSAEYQIITKKNIPFFGLKTGKLVRKWTRQTFLYGIWQFFLLFIGFFQAFFIIARIRPHVITSFGGYLAVPIVFWGRLFGAKIVTHEQTVVAGLANKIIARFAHTICISWEESKKYFPKSKVILTGNPIRKELFAENSEGLPIKVDTSKRTLYITGGNQGAQEINHRVFEVLPELLTKVNIIHQTGTRNFEEAVRIKHDLSQDLQNSYYIQDYFSTQELAYIFKNIDCMFSRAGANTVTEVLVFQIPTIFMPIPWVSHNEQILNAQYVVQNGHALIFEQKDENDSKKLLQTITLFLKTLNEKKSWNTYAIRENAAQKVAAIILSYLG